MRPIGSEAAGLARHMARSLLDRLSSQTSRLHARIDEAMFGDLEFPTTAGYRRFLCLFYGFQAPLENAITKTPKLDHELLEIRSKAGRLAHDLMSIGLTRHEHVLLARRRPIIPVFENPAQALGWMYATERLMLHVEPLRIRLESEMPVVMALAHQFLYAYVNTAELRWRQFGAMLERTAKKHDVETLLAAACAGTEALSTWLTGPTVSLRAATSEETAPFDLASA
jgi:heme oxygenase